MLDSTERLAQAVAVRDGRIAAVGTNEQVQRYAGGRTERIDLKGHAITPGLIDAHAHFNQAGMDVRVRSRDR